MGRDDTQDEQRRQCWSEEDDSRNGGSVPNWDFVGDFESWAESKGSSIPIPTPRRTSRFGAQIGLWF